MAEEPSCACEVAHDEFARTCSTGDLLLHEGVDSLGSALLRAGGRSAFVHVAFVIRDPPWADFKRFDGAPMLLECSGRTSRSPDCWSGEFGTGVRLVKLWDCGAEEGLAHRNGRMWWRKSHWQPTIEEWRQLRSTLEQVIGRPYSYGDLLAAGCPFSWPPATRRMDSFTCTSLVGYILAQVGGLDPTLRWSRLTPTNFSAHEGRELPFTRPLDEERPIQRPSVV